MAACAPNFGVRVLSFSENGTLAAYRNRHHVTRRRLARPPRVRASACSLVYKTTKQTETEDRANLLFLIAVSLVLEFPLSSSPPAPPPPPALFVVLSRRVLYCCMPVRSSSGRERERE